MNLHYLSDNIRDVLDDGKEWGITIRYSIEDHPLGTAGAVKNAEEFFRDEPEIIVFNGDILTDANISEIVKYHREKKATATITLTRVEDPTPYGWSSATNTAGSKSSWRNRAGSGWKTAARKISTPGYYVLDPKIFREMPADTPVSFERKIFPDLLAKGEPVFGYQSGAYWIDIGSPANTASPTKRSCGARSRSSGSTAAGKRGASGWGNGWRSTAPPAPSARRSSAGMLRSARRAAFSGIFRDWRPGHDRKGDDHRQLDHLGGCGSARTST